MGLFNRNKKKNLAVLLAAIDAEEDNPLMAPVDVPPTEPDPPVAAIEGDRSNDEFRAWCADRAAFYRSRM
jgi:hypothetical protein